jgi:hypothetical protein
LHEVTSRQPAAYVSRNAAARSTRIGGFCFAAARPILHRPRERSQEDGAMRIELVMCVLAGTAGGLCGTAWGALVSNSLLRGAAIPAATPVPWRESTAAFVKGAMLYAASGAALGLLFWLGWGLAAFVNLSWPVVGLVYAGLIYCAGALPVLGMLHQRLREPPRIVAVIALEWLVACAAIGLLCAMAWHRAG